VVIPNQDSGGPRNVDLSKTFGWGCRQVTFIDYVRGLDFDDDNVFEMQVIQKAFLPKTKDGPDNLLFESQQNLSVLLFGLTVDDVRKTLLVSFLSPVLTIFLFYFRALVS
jgi:hypothetical protein